MVASKISWSQEMGQGSTEKDIVMPREDPMRVPEARELTPEEGRAFFDDEAQRLMGISGTEFIRRWEKDQFGLDDLDEDKRVLHLWMIMPFGR